MPALHFDHAALMARYVSDDANPVAGALILFSGCRCLRAAHLKSANLIIHDSTFDKLLHPHVLPARWARGVSVHPGFDARSMLLRKRFHVAEEEARQVTKRDATETLWKLGSKTCWYRDRNNGCNVHSLTLRALAESCLTRPGRSRFSTGGRLGHGPQANSAAAAA
eukprot:3137785-Rhodomonas_salina.1